MEATYIFNITPTKGSLTSKGAIWVEFARHIAPKLNNDGEAQCKLNDTVAYCKFVDE